MDEVEDVSANPWIYATREVIEQILLYRGRAFGHRVDCESDICKKTGEEVLESKAAERHDLMEAYREFRPMILDTDSPEQVFGEEDDVAGRMLMIERLGGILKYNDVADKVFRSNLCMIDLHFPRMLGEMLRVMHLDGISKVSDLTEAIKQINPLKIKDELIHKHSYYEYKMKQFLMALALGMRPAKIFNGIDSAISGFLFVNGNGEVLCYQKADRQVFADFLFVNSRFEKSSTEKDKYGYLERENGVYYFKLNLKIGLLKR